MEALTSALLYLNGVNVSFDGFKALNNLSLTIEPGEMRAIIGPNGAGKTTMMDVVTGKTRPGHRRRHVRRILRPHPARRGRNRRTRHRPQVPEAHGIPKPDRQRQPRTRAEVRPPRPRHAVVARRRQERRSDRRLSRHHPLDRGAPPLGRQPVARPAAMAGDRHAAGAGAEAASGRRAGRRHDRRRNPRRPRSCSRRSISTARLWWSSTTWPSCASSVSRSPCLHEGSVLAEAPSTRSQQTSAWSKCIWGASA